MSKNRRTMSTPQTETCETPEALEKKHGRSQAYMLRVKFDHPTENKYYYYDSPKDLSAATNIPASTIIQAVKFGNHSNLTIRNKDKVGINFESIERLPLVVNGVCVKQQKEMALPVIKMLYNCDDERALEIFTYSYLEKLYQ